MERNGLLSADFAQEFEPLVSAFFITPRATRKVSYEEWYRDKGTYRVIEWMNLWRITCDGTVPPFRKAVRRDFYGLKDRLQHRLCF
jgi:hypothetical protein